MFRIDIDAKTRLVHIRIGGMLSPDEAEAYVATIKRAFVSQIGNRPYVMLIDTSEALIQSADVVKTFQAHIACFPKATRIAIINGSSLARMQLKRILDRDYLRYFDTVGEGLRWLRSEPTVATTRTPATLPAMTGR